MYQLHPFLDWESLLVIYTLVASYLEYCITVNVLRDHSEATVDAEHSNTCIAT